MWVSKLDFPTGCVWMSWHLFQKDLIFVCLFPESKSYGYWKEVFTVSSWKMATIQTYLSNTVSDLDNPVVSVINGPSTTNKIERWWRDLYECLEKYFKEYLIALLRRNLYNPNGLYHRKLLTFVCNPVVQKECDIFVENWNSHWIRQQIDLHP